MCIHHMPDHRKQGLFAEIFEHLAPGGWYLNYDPVPAEDPVVESTWERVNDLIAPRWRANASIARRWSSHATRTTCST